MAVCLIMLNHLIFLSSVSGSACNRYMCDLYAVSLCSIG